MKKVVVSFALILGWIMSVQGFGQDYELWDLADAQIKLRAEQASQKGMYAESERYYREALRRAEASGPAHRVAALGNVAQALADQGRLSEAEGFFSRALHEAPAELVDRRVRGVLLLNAAVLYTATGRASTAAPMLRESLQSLEAAFGQDSAEVASVLRSIGILEATNGRYKAAETALARALAIGEKRMIAKPGALASITASLASVYAATKQWDKSEALFQRTLGLLADAFGHDHPRTASTLAQLAELQIMRGEPAAAERYFRNALATQQKLYNPDYFGIAVIASHLASALAAQKKYDEARPLFVTALEAQKHVRTIRPADYVYTLEQFSRLLRNTADTAAAEELESLARLVRAEMAYTVRVEQLRR